MKTIILSILFFLILNPFSNACGDAAVIYKAKFHMNDGTCHTGYFEVIGFEDYNYLDDNDSNAYCSDSGILDILDQWVKEREDWLSNLDDPGSFMLYKEIHYTNVKNEEFPVEGLTLAIVTPEDKISIRLEEVAATEFISAEYSKRDYYTAGFLTGPKELVDLLQERPMVSQLYIDAEETIGVSYLMLNFNDWVNHPEMKRLKNLKVDKLSYPDLYCEDFIYMDELNRPQYDFDRQKAAYRDYENQVQEVKSWFYNWNIVLVEVWEGC